MTHQGTSAASVFDAAKAIVESLHGLDPKQQEQAIRFASESIGVRAPSSQRREDKASTPEVPHTADTTHSTDIKQFTNAKSPKSDQQFAAVAAYFYRFEAPESDRKDAIDMDDLKDAARLVANRRVPGVSVLNNAKNAGYLDSAGRGKFKINTVGENLVAMTLPGNGADDSGARRRRKKKANKKVTPAKKKAHKKKTKKKVRKKNAVRKRTTRRKRTK